MPSWRSRSLRAATGIAAPCQRCPLFILLELVAGCPGNPVGVFSLPLLCKLRCLALVVPLFNPLVLCSAPVGLLLLLLALQQLLLRIVLWLATGTASTSSRRPWGVLI